MSTGLGWSTPVSSQFFVGSVTLRTIVHELLVCLPFLFAIMSTVGNRVTTKHYLPENVGTEQFLLVHQYGVVDASTSGGIYIETSLHADELCGMLVIHHLLKLL